MGSKRNRPQIKRKKTLQNYLEEELNEIEAGNLQLEFKVMIIKMLNSMNKDLETIKKDW